MNPTPACVHWFAMRQIGGRETTLQCLPICQCLYLSSLEWNKIGLFQNYAKSCIFKFLMVEEMPLLSEMNYEALLMKDLFVNYTKDVRPTRNFFKPVEVYLGYSLGKIEQMVSLYVVWIHIAFVTSESNWGSSNTWLTSKPIFPIDAWSWYLCCG